MSKFITRMSGPQRGAALLTCGAALLLVLAFTGDEPTSAQGQGSPQGDEAKARIGFEITPVPLDLRGKNPALVGLGSYFVNAVGGCTDCHTSPQFFLGGDPFNGQPEQINTDGFLAGGRAFGPFISRNLTPDGNGLPAGMTFDEFEFVMRTGADVKHVPPNDLLQVMPWPVYSKMSSRDMEAVYEYLSAIPSLR